MASDDGPIIAEPGTVLAGKLRVERVIGQGAMGVVYECTDTRTSQRVAVKLMSNMNDAELRARFAREARAAATLTSDHAVRVLEVGESDGGVPFIVMELLTGRSLESIVDGSGPIPVSSCVDWILQALDAVGEAHANGIVHRDLKPGNLFLTDRPGREPIVKVLDFGVVKLTDPMVARLTKTGASPGTPGYMSPEQVRALPGVDARADVWSMGATMHELLTGRLPFAAPTVPDMLARILQEDPDPIRERRPEISKPIEAVVKRCMSRDPKDRYASADELADALEQATQGPSFTLRMDRRQKRRAAGGTEIMAPITPKTPNAPPTPAAESPKPAATSPSPPAATPRTRPPAPSSPGERDLATARIPRPRRAKRTSRTKIFILSAAIALGLGAAILFIMLIGAAGRTSPGPMTSATAIARRHLGNDAGADDASP